MPTKSIVLLYSEMAGYMISGLKSLCDRNYSVTVFHWPINKEAPFKFEQVEGLTFYDRSNFSYEALLDKVKEISPSAILVSGWMDKDYLKVTKKFKGKIPTIVGLDNHWTGSVKQKILKMASPFVIRNTFSHAWVAGEPQAVYARKLGFTGDNLLHGIYSADLIYFKKQYTLNKDRKSKQFPKVFLFVGRYIKHKGIFELWKAFIELKNETPNSWKLFCVGTGEEFENRELHEDIEHFGFLQPKELSKVIADSGVFVLPSRFEPWGVVVQEFAAAGLPLLLSEEIGASSAFLKTDKNGFSFKANNPEDIKRVMRSIMQQSDAELNNMSDESYRNADWITPEKWSEKLIQLL